MSIEIRVPQLPESVTDATLVAWHKKPGEAVSRDENLVDLETDKVVRREELLSMPHLNVVPIPVLRIKRLRVRMSVAKAAE